jgi:acetolactate synthase-1/2/3 large subunit
VPEETIRGVAAALRKANGRCGLVLSGPAARARPLQAAARIAAATGARLFGDMFVPRAERGSGRVPLERIPYPVDRALEVLGNIDVLILVGASPPVAFFAYPGKPSRLTRDDARVLTLARPGDDAAAALDALAEELGATLRPVQHPSAPVPDSRMTGTLTDEAVSIMLAQLLPEGAIVIDEALTSARALFAMTANAPPHDYLMVCTGGAIGAGLPVATGAAVACPGRKVLSLQADGSGMYTLQALWTQARENLDVVTVIFANRAYAILQTEMRAVGVNHFGRNAGRMLSLDEPNLDWVALAQGMGVEGVRVESADRFFSTLQHALTRRGPFLIEAVLSPTNL